MRAVNSSSSILKLWCDGPLGANFMEAVSPTTFSRVGASPSSSAPAVTAASATQRVITAGPYSISGWTRRPPPRPGDDRAAILTAGRPVHLPDHRDGWRGEPYAGADVEAARQQLQRLTRDAEAVIAEARLERGLADGARRPPARHPAPPRPGHRGGTGSRPKRGADPARLPAGVGEAVSRPGGGRGRRRGGRRASPLRSAGGRRSSMRFTCCRCWSGSTGP